MKISIHQPNFAPWLGYYHKWVNADTFVFLDDVIYSKNSFINRNIIKSPNGKQWITVPVLHKGHANQLINTVEINNAINWQRKIIGSIQANYSKTKYFQKLFLEISEIISHKYKRLIDINVELTRWIIIKLNIEVPYILSSELKHIRGVSTERLISICNELGADKYICGSGGDKYQNMELFDNNNIKVISSSFQYPTYTQIWGDFSPNLSILDVLFNCGVIGTKKLLSAKTNVQLKK